MMVIVSQSGVAICTRASTWGISGEGSESGSAKMDRRPKAAAAMAPVTRYGSGIANGTPRRLPELPPESVQRA